jgi:hypothetical protein
MRTRGHLLRFDEEDAVYRGFGGMRESVNYSTVLDYTREQLGR